MVEEADGRVWGDEAGAWDVGAVVCVWHVSDERRGLLHMCMLFLLLWMCAIFSELTFLLDF